MRSIIISLCFTFLSCTLFAQFDYSFDFVSSVDLNTRPFPLSSENTSYNYRVGGNFNVRVIDKVFIKSGIRYAEVSRNEGRENLIWPSEIVLGGIVLDPTLPRYRLTTSTQKFIEMPLVVRIEMGGKKFRFFLEFGMGPLYYIETEVIESTNLDTKTRILKETDFGQNRFRNTVIFSLGINYKVSEKYQLFLQPITRKFTNLDVQPFLDTRMRNIGIEFGLRRGFSFDSTFKK